jgi:FkbM family methyltransferase
MSICTEEDICYCFRLILGREPSPEEWQDHQVHVGKDLQAVVEHYITSLEFKYRNLGGLPEPKLAELDSYKMYVDPNDPHIGNPIAEGKPYEPHVTRAIRNALGPGMTFLDVGANMGYYSLMAASLGAKVIAIEPLQSNIQLLNRSMKANGFDMEIYPFAAMDRRGLIPFNHVFSDGQVFPTEDQRYSQYGDFVYADQLDNLVENADIIKIDVEGADYLAMRGASRLLALKPIIFAEFAPTSLKEISGVAGEGYLQLFIDHGYNIFVLGESIIDCGNDINKIMKIYRESMGDHIDLYIAGML